MIFGSFLIREYERPTDTITEFHVPLSLEGLEILKQERLLSHKDFFC